MPKIIQLILEPVEGATYLMYGLDEVGGVWGLKRIMPGVGAPKTDLWETIWEPIAESPRRTNRQTPPRR